VLPAVVSLKVRALVQLAISPWPPAQKPETMSVVPSLHLPPATTSIGRVAAAAATSEVSRSGRPTVVRITSTSLPGVNPSVSIVVTGMGLTEPVPGLVFQFPAVLVLVGLLEPSV